MPKTRHIKKHIIINVLFLLMASTVYPQYNLVPNPSFEQYTICPSSATLSDFLNSKPDNWYKPDNKGGGYYNACTNDGLGVPKNTPSCGSSFQYARTGVAYMGGFYLGNPGTNIHHYFQVKLTDSLRQGRCYYGEYYVNLGNCFNHACNNIGMLFTSDSIKATISPTQQLILANPQITSFGNAIISDTVNWVKVSGVFTAQGGEQYLTLGNFKTDAQTSYVQWQTTGGSGAGYYVDDVSVIPLDSMPLKADAGRDTTIAHGSSVYIGSYTNGLIGVTWYDNTGAIIATGVPGLTVSPASSSWYVIDQTVCGYHSRDTVLVFVGPVPLKILDYSVKSAEGEVQNNWSTANEKNASRFNIQKSRDGRDFYTFHSQPANNNSINHYSYTDVHPFSGSSYYRVQCIDKDGSATYTVIRHVVTDRSATSLVLYPNPASTVLNFETSGITHLQIVDALGRIVISKPITQPHTTLNVESLPKGIYAVKALTSDKTIIQQKFIKE